MLDQVWLQLRCIPDIMFAFCYIPPTDSTYYNHNLFSNLHLKMSDYKNYKNVCIIGDLNARFGNSVRNIPSSSNNPDIQSCSYPNIPDDITSPNDSAYLLSSICVDNNLIVLNNVKTNTCYFPSQKTFKRNRQWLSEIDTMVTSFAMLNDLENFTVHQTDWLPSNHAPISIDLKLPKVNLDLLLTRAENLGGHGSLMGQTARERTVNRPVRFDHVNTSVFSDMLRDITIPEVNNNIDLMANNISETIYNCVRSCSKTNSEQNELVGLMPTTDDLPRSYHSRWDQLLNDPDNSSVWKALDWKGEFIDRNSNNTNQSSPSDAQFQNLYEVQINQYFNFDQVYNPDNNYMTNIPLLDDNFTPLEVNNQNNELKIR